MKLDKIPKKQHREVVGINVAVDLPPFERPKWADKIRWPDDITQLTAQNVSELLGKFTELLCYAESQLAKYKQAILFAEDSIARLRLEVISEDELAMNRLEKNKRELRIDSDPGMTKMKSRLRALRRCEVAAQMFVTNYERRIAALSRELSRKTASGDGLRFARTGRE
jgi:hypothetical protein